MNEVEPEVSHSPIGGRAPASERTRRTTRLLRALRSGLEVTVLLTALLASALIVKELWRPSGRPEASSMPVPSTLVSLDGAPQKGRGAATVMIIYSDFQCPYCARFVRDTLPQIDKEYVGKGILDLAFRNLPLETIHPFAVAAAEAALCAGRQGRFWQWHDAVFLSNSVPERETVLQVSGRVGLDMAEFTDCIQGDDVKQSIKREAEEARALGVRSTPTFVLGDRDPTGRVRPRAMFSGSRHYRDFKVAIDRLISRNATR